MNISSNQPWKPSTTTTTTTTTTSWTTTWTTTTPYSFPWTMSCGVKTNYNWHSVTFWLGFCMLEKAQFSLWLVYLWLPPLNYWITDTHEIKSKSRNWHISTSEGQFYLKNTLKVITAKVPILTFYLKVALHTISWFLAVCVCRWQIKSPGITTISNWK